MLRGSGGAKDSWDAFERAGFCNVLVWSDNALVSFLTMLKREALFDGRQVILGGVSSGLCEPGWRTVPCRVEIAQPSGTVIWPERIMLLSNADAVWRPRTVDLCGLPF